MCATQAFDVWRAKALNHRERPGRMNASPTCRPRDHLIAASRLYPKAWSSFDEFRDGRGKDLPDWPQWCFVPMAGAYAVVNQDRGSQQLGLRDLHLVGDVSRLAAIGAWRPTQGIYRFDPAVYAAVRDTPISGDLPHDVLFRLPEWCVYVETPGMEFGGPLHGFFAHLEWDANSGRTELRLLLDSETTLQGLPLHLGNWSLQESIQRATDVASVAALGAGFRAFQPVASELHAVMEPIISMLLYLCSQNAEVGDGVHRPAHPVPKRVKGGMRLFPAERVTTWDVGVRLGSALRRAYQAEQTGNGTHVGPRPHVRRSHWHGFRSGPMKLSDGTDIATADRKFELRWLPPIAVNLYHLDDLPATIRPVK